MPTDIAKLIAEVRAIVRNLGGIEYMTEDECASVFALCEALEAAEAERARLRGGYLTRDTVQDLTKYLGELREYMAAPISEEPDPQR